MDKHSQNIELVALTRLDTIFADFVTAHVDEPRYGPLWLAAALISCQTADGHICLQLAEFSGKKFRFDESGSPVLTVPTMAAWLAALGSSRAVGRCGDFRPLVLDGERLYLQRYWLYEQELLEDLKALAGQEPPGVNNELLRTGVDRLFPSDNRETEIDWQKIAAITAVLKRFCIISGSPGTGKTTIVFKILLLLLEQNRAGDFRAALAAPTGKAANRLKESIKKWKSHADVGEETGTLIPDEVFTLHRLLGGRLFSSTFRFDRENPLPYDLVVVDEGSMVDLPLLVKLLRALPPQGRLILLGDKNQLASVEAGAAFSDLCGTREESRFSPGFGAALQCIVGEERPLPETETSAGLMDDSIVILRKNYRFSEGSGIHRLSRLVNQGKGHEAFDLMGSGKITDCIWHDVPPAATLGRWLVQRHAAHYEALFSSTSPEEFLSRFHAFIILCAVRRGPWGVEGVNAAIEKELQRTGFDAGRGYGKGNRPIMITANDYRLGLYNGDIGVLFQDGSSQRPAAFFPSETGALRRLSPARLPRHEIFFAMTVHKSQGSEFKRLLFLLPDRDSELLTRELVYTAITRAREEVEIAGVRGTFLQAVSRKISRASGIGAALQTL